MLGNGSPVLISRDRFQKDREVSFSLPVRFGVGTGSGENEHLSGASTITPHRFLCLTGNDSSRLPDCGPGDDSDQSVFGRAIGGEE